MPSDIINVESYNPAGNGLSNDTAAIQAAFSDAAGGVLLFPDSTKSYAIFDTLNISPRTRIINAGASFVVRANLRTAIDAGHDFQADLLRIRLGITAPPGGAAQVSRALVLQSRTSVERIEISSTAQQTNTKGHHAGLYLAGDGIKLGYVRVSGFNAAVLLKECEDVFIQVVRIDKYLTGLHLAGCKFVEVGSGSITETSNTSVGNKDIKGNVEGYNGLLIEDCTDLVVSDLIVHDSIEHGIRIGGRGATRRCSFNNIQVRRAGWNGMKVQPRTKADYPDEPETNGSASEIQINGLLVLDCAPHLGRMPVSATLDDPGRSGLRLDSCSNVVVNGLRVGRDESPYYSASYGLHIARSRDVTVNAPRISDTYLAGIVLSDRWDKATPAAVNQIFIRDPSITFLVEKAHPDNAPKADGILIESREKRLRDIAITGCYVRGQTGYGVKIDPSGGVTWPLIVEGWVKKEGDGVKSIPLPADSDLHDHIVEV